jgi:hypothetical protein
MSGGRFDEKLIMFAVCLALFVLACSSYYQRLW